MIMYVSVDDGGFPIAFYSSELNAGSVPGDAAELTNAQYAELINNNGLRRFVGGQVVVYEPPPAPPAPRIIYKADIWRRATNAEADIMDAMLDSQPARLRRMWADAQYLQSDDELYATIEAALIAQFGATRSAELLA